MFFVFFCTRVYSPLKNVTHFSLKQNYIRLKIGRMGGIGFKSGRSGFKVVKIIWGKEVKWDLKSSKNGSKLAQMD